jgi:DNA-binding transcriptional regulator YiaG
MRRGHLNTGSIMATKTARDIRKKLGLNQKSFWEPLGVTQSAGSRYETGREIPAPVQKLISIAYGTDRERVKVLAEIVQKEKAA